MTYPTYRSPGDRDREYLLEVAAAATEETPPGQPPAIWTLLGDSSHLEDIMRDYQRAVDELIAARDAHQVTTLELEHARDACAIAEADAARLRRTAARLRGELDDSSAVPTPIDAALDSACETITARLRGHVDASLDAELAAHPEGLGPYHHARDQRVPEVDPDAFEDPSGGRP